MKSDSKRVVYLEDFGKNITKRGIWGRCGEISGLSLMGGRNSTLLSLQKYWMKPFSKISLAYTPAQASLVMVTKGVLTISKSREEKISNAVLKERSIALLEGKYVFTFMTGSMPTEFLVFNSRAQPTFNPEEYEHIKHTKLDDLDEFSDQNGGPKVKASEAMDFGRKSNILDFLELRLNRGNEIKYHRNKKAEIYGIIEPQKGRMVLKEGTGSAPPKDVAVFSSGLVGSMDNCHGVKAVDGPVRAFVYVGKLLR